MESIYLLAILYAIMIPSFLYTIDKHKKILDFIKKSVKQYIEYMDDVPIEYSVGK